ncbi:hypothetical protein Leryth_023369 [Lithospermum erythrorhizon]|nr:hypothetical protein Leryth_023369 [Lithospermum erythrorhizon]
MGASRKLQAEIDRVLKKVQEGVEVFDSIWKKVYDTDNANQKEKFEADLKKEIKKLQRYRDQIKTWIQSSEIKDKKVSASYEQSLMDARKTIEREMERFKICEKETKTKAFSKEGLGQQPKTVSELENQIDAFEAEMEGLTVKKGKMRPPRLTHLETSIVRHKAHIMKLELILRLLDNDELSPEQVNDVKDFIDDYVERNQEDFDEFYDVDELYCTLPLDKVESLEDLVTIGPPGLVKGGNTVISMKNHLATSPTQVMATVTSTVQSGVPTLEQGEETNSQDNNSEVLPKTPNPKASGIVVSIPPTPGYASPGSSIASSPIGMSNAVKEEENASSLLRKLTPALAETNIKGVKSGGLSSQLGFSIPLSSGSSIPTNGTTPASETTKRAEDRVGSSSLVQPLASPLANRTMPQSSRAGDEISSAGAGNAGEAGGSANHPFSPSVVPGMQWGPGNAFQNQNDVGHIRGRTEFAPDQQEKFLQRLQQVQQQGQSNIMGIPTVTGGNHEHFASQQQNPLFQQQQQVATHQPSNQQTLSKDAEVGHGNVSEQQQSEELSIDADPNSELSKKITNDDDMKTSYGLDSPAGLAGSVTETSHVPRDADFSPRQQLRSNQPSGTLGVIGRRSMADLGTIGDSFTPSVTSSGGMQDQLHNLRMLEAAFYKLPQPKDSERPKNYTPRHPAATPPSYPQVQAPIVNNPAFWERLGADNYGTDTLFFAFYYQPNTYQQYLAAKELKRNSWRYHSKFNTWFQRHEEPKVATDDFEQGTYVYFDFHIANEEQNGWCQRIKTDFTFEYNYLEDELVA